MKRTRQTALKTLLFSGLCSLSIYGTAQDTNQSDKDFYTAIAGHAQTTLGERPMEEINPVHLPEGKHLGWSNNRRHAYPKQKKIETKEDMLTALGKLKQQYAPFMQDLAPQMQEKRLSFRIDSMQFRYETPEDCRDFSLLEKGSGEWKEIAMPYYHGPQGPSTAWYRQEITVSQEILDMPAVYLHFNGSDYYTDAFINGHHVGYHEGMLDEFEFNIKKYLRNGKNTLLIKVRNDYSMLGGEGTPRRWGNKLSASNCPGWDDPFSGWSCCPTGYGVYQDVYIEGRSTPFIADVFCRPLIDEKAVELWTEVDLENGELADAFLLRYSLFGQNFEQTVVKDAEKPIQVEGGRVLTKVRIDIPDEAFRLWSPDEPWLYQMQVSLYDKTGKQLLDNGKRQFGLRHFVINTHSTPKGRMYLNGKEIRLRGTNTMGFLQRDVMAHDWEQLTDDLLLAKLTNMNFIRTTQRIVQKEVYEYADRLGMMMQADLPLFAYINQKQYTEILKQAGNIERVLRNHPSVILMSYLNEPMAEVKPHAISRYAYERLFDALDIVVRNENPDRAVKYIDGDYQAPSNGFPDNHCYNIWYDEHGVPLDRMCRGAWMPVSKGWMYGCGEFGAEGLDSEDVIRKHYPQEWLKCEADGSWSPKYMHGIYQGEQTWGKHWDWFETQTTIPDWIRESCNHQAWGVEKVARAFRRMPRMNSFAVHLFIDNWPNGWMKAIMDCERNPKLAWFKYRDALTPLTVQVEGERKDFFSGETFDFPVWICNDTQRMPEAELRYVLEVNGKTVNSGSCPADMPSVTDGSRYQGSLPVTMPKVKKETHVCLRVALFDKNQNRLIHEDIAQCRVYPVHQTGSTITVTQLGQSQDAESVIRNQHLSGHDVSVSSADVILVSDSLLTADTYNQLKERAEQGSTVIFLKDALSQSAGKLLDITSAIQDDDSWIVFRNKEHRWLKGSSSTDLKYNYSARIAAPERHYFRCFQASGYTPVLTHTDRMVVAEKEIGKGQIVLCGLKLDGKLETTPVLNKMIYSLINNK